MELQKVHGRSIPGFDLHDALYRCSKYLEKYGGHAMAVGLSLKQENFENFKKEAGDIMLCNNYGSGIFRVWR